jgi:hypothetical protein
MTEFKDERRLYHVLCHDRRRIGYLVLRRIANERPLSRTQRWMIKLSVLTMAMSAVYAVILPSLALAVMCGYVTAFLSVTSGSVAERLLNV